MQPGNLGPRHRAGGASSTHDAGASSTRRGGDGGGWGARVAPSDVIPAKAGSQVTLQRSCVRRWNGARGCGRDLRGTWPVRPDDLGPRLRGGDGGEWGSRVPRNRSDFRTDRPTRTSCPRRTPYSALSSSKGGRAGRGSTSSPRRTVPTGRGTSRDVIPAKAGTQITSQRRCARRWNVARGCGGDLRRTRPVRPGDLGPRLRGGDGGGWGWRAPHHCRKNANRSANTDVMPAARTLLRPERVEGRPRRPWFDRLTTEDRSNRKAQVRGSLKWRARPRAWSAASIPHAARWPGPPPSCRRRVFDT